MNDNFCPELMQSGDEEVVPYVPCSKIYDAGYCVKTIGVNGGEREVGWGWAQMLDLLLFELELSSLVCKICMYCMACLLSGFLGRLGLRLRCHIIRVLAVSLCRVRRNYEL